MNYFNEPINAVSEQPKIYELPNGERRCDVGLTKLEHFTALAMQAALSNSRLRFDCSDIAEMAIKTAKETLTLLEKERGNYDTNK